MTTAAIFDLDRTLITASTTPIFMRHLAATGISVDSSVPLLDPIVGAASKALKTVFDVVGESRLLVQPAKLAVRAASGWWVTDVEAAGQPRYDLVETTGRQHEQEFKVVARLQDGRRAEGVGKTKRAAEKVAAEVLLGKLTE